MEYFDLEDFLIEFWSWSFHNTKMEFSYLKNGVFEVKDGVFEV